MYSCKMQQIKTKACRGRPMCLPFDCRTARLRGFAHKGYPMVLCRLNKIQTTEKTKKAFFLSHFSCSSFYSPNKSGPKKKKNDEETTLFPSDVSEKGAFFKSPSGTKAQSEKGKIIISDKHVVSKIALSA
ncbi:MAG: hypothetical protein A2Y62_19210 [Candidatus Fischerbacteria bacterium RBG_13_37_8]|uniref:Uncharacterized protein n=1 Tax=Candidatus Fischerbacteria bacterium RBG_13_37_8 TaxID=1817863 RepID=A0A1F5VUT6_9BACT|nr:MAG: hypothetical protein A2Y62_19210 [Candidatus Fischerbacteria bacterium RBG_13_37_8]